MGIFTDKLVGKKIAVVGGSSGTGYGVAGLFLNAGALVVIISSSSEKVEMALKKLNNPNATGAAGDVRDENNFTRLLLSLAPIDHVVFSAIDNIIRGDLREMNLDEASDLFGVKYWGAVICGKACLKRDIINPTGSLTFTSGLVAIKPGKNAAIGGALNASVRTLTKGLAADFSEKKCDKEVQETVTQKTAFKLPVGFVAKPEHVAETHLYAVRADYATGSVITIDGGASVV